MKTNKTEHAKEILDANIRQAKEYDERGDVTLRNQIVQRLLGDEMGLSTAYVRAALKNAGLIR